MGTNASYKRKKYLSKSDIDFVFSKKPALTELFLKLRNGDGQITINELKVITNELINISVLKKIMHICGSSENSLSYDDFLYFYALLNTSSTNAKINFILDFIFIKKNVLLTERYIHKVKKYFENSDVLLNILLNEKLINNKKDSKIGRETVLNFINKNYYDKISQYELYKDNSDNSIINNNNLIIHTNNDINENISHTNKYVYISSENRNELISENNVLILKTNSSNSIISRKSIPPDNISKSTTLMPKKKKYNYLHREFQNYEKMHNGIFPISLFEEMLKEIDVIPSVIDIVGNYLRQKTQKSFFNFDLFKEILSIISIPIININEMDDEKNRTDIINGLFTLFAFPNDYIYKKSFFLFIKSTKPELSSSEIKDLFKKNNIEKVINKNQFEKMIDFVIDELIVSFEHMKYIPFIFFGADFPEKIIEKNCIEILLKKQSLVDYIQERLKYDNIFYIVDKSFWDKWKQYVLSIGNNKNSNNENLNANINITNTNNNSNANEEKSNVNNIIDNKTNKENNSLIDNILINDDKNYNNNKFKENYTNNDKDYKDDIDNRNIKNTNNIELKMITKKICDKDGRIKEGLVYFKDYIVLSSRMYNLFYRWYGPPINMEIKREKICINDDDEEIGTLTPRTRLNISKSLHRSNSLLYSEDIRSHKKYEIEIFPVFLLFFNFLDMQKKNCITMEHIINNIKSSLTSKTGVRYYPFSRKVKFGELLRPLQESINMKLNKKNARLWIYYQERFEIMPLTDSLEKHGIINSAVIVLEINENNYWPSEKLVKEPLNKIRRKSLSLVGLVNIGNTCYMNSILQIFLNIQEIRDIFIKEQSQDNQQFLNFIINKKKGNGELVIEFINILKEKWIKNKKTITPKKFKEICGKYNETFKGSDQQDAHDFYTFLVDNLHEDTNIKLQNTKITNSETVDTSEEELSNEHWANAVRNNASYIYGLFMGQLKSSLTCNVCNLSKLKYETFSALELPIPEGGNIVIEIILFRLPCTLSPFYKIELNNNTFSKSFSKKNNILHNELTINIRKKLKKIKQKSIGKYAEETMISPMASEREENINKRFYDMDKLKPLVFENQKKEENYTGDEIISDALNLNIPIKLRLQIDRTKKCREIIERIKGMKELELELDGKYTEFLMVSKNNYVQEDSIIDETCLPFQQVFIYELLNYEGIKKVFGYDDLKSFNVIPLNKQDVQNMIELNDEENETNDNLTLFSKENSTNQINSQNHFFQSDIKDFTVKNPSKNVENSNNRSNTVYKDGVISEVLIQIFHRYKSISNNVEYEYDYLFNSQNYIYIKAYRDFIILTTKNSIKPINLYEIMWEKYMYFLDSPSKYEQILWWKQFKSKQQPNENSFGLKNIKNINFIPFTIKVIKKGTKSCAFCPWFRFCSGCILNPSKDSYLSISPDSLIVLEWKKEIISKEIKENNTLLILNHSSSNNLFESNENEDEKITIYDCLNLFTHKETMKDVYCENCKKKVTFTKKLEIDKLPHYLVIVLKRFKYTAMFTRKIESLINFPLEELDLKEYITQKRETPKFELFSVVNHGGSLTGGHYQCSVRQDNMWVKYDDSYTCEDDKKIETANAYLLVYKCNTRDYFHNNKKDFQFNFIGLMDTAYKIYLKQFNFEHLFNYVLNEKEEIQEEYLNNCEYYFGEPLTINGNSGYLINMHHDDENIYIKIKLKKGYLNTKISKEKIIKETIKKELTVNEVTDLSVDTQKTKENNKGDTFCGGCKIF